MQYLRIFYTFTAPMNLKQVISLLFISLVLVNLAHNAVPHHHHSEIMNAHEGCEDHDSDINDLKAGDPCTHCHAFNGIQYFPLENKIKINELKILGNGFFTLPGDLHKSFQADSQEIFKPSDQSVRYRGSDPGVISQRGPPSTC
jgi:hypothetical protein